MWISETLFCSVSFGLCRSTRTQTHFQAKMETMTKRNMEEKVRCHCSRLIPWSNETVKRRNKDQRWELWWGWFGRNGHRQNRQGRRRKKRKQTSQGYGRTAVRPTEYGNQLQKLPGKHVQHNRIDFNTVSLSCVRIRRRKGPIPLRSEWTHSNASRSPPREFIKTRWPCGLRAQATFAKWKLSNLRGMGRVSLSITYTVGNCGYLGQEETTTTERTSHFCTQRHITNWSFRKFFRVGVAHDPSR